jgi:nitrite reductase (NO-forming)
VNHDYAAIFTGAASIFVAGDPFGLNEQLGTNAASYADLLGNPSDAVPPMGKNSLEQKLNLHGLYTDERADELKSELGL